MPTPCWNPSNSANIISTPEVFAWGFNYVTASNTALPQEVNISGLPPHAYIVKIINGLVHCLALDNLGNVYAQGFNQRGQLGNNTTIYQRNFLPVNISALPPGIKFKDIAASRVTSMILSTTGQIYTFGGNAFGELGNGTVIAFSSLPGLVVSTGVLDRKNIVKISACGFNMAALDDQGCVYTWGIGVGGQLGNGGNLLSNVPVQVLTTTRYRDIFMGSNAAIAITMSGTLNTWGNGGNGALGNGLTSNSNIPVAVIGVTGEQFINANISSVAGGAVSTTGEVYTWGRNFSGGLGQGLANTSDIVLTPQRVRGIITGIPMKNIVVNNDNVQVTYMMTLSREGQVYAWGYNARDNLGDGTFMDSNVPVGAVAGALADKIVTQISGGDQSSALTQ